ncbi:hypothetical protein HY004_01970 [Candidatus Saccharibacteria bacterium]|nr:hypothetical protein [Candidatus Saccharibacteria bacterium]
MDYDSPVSRYSTTIRFVAIAAVLVILLVVGLVFSKRIVASMTSEPTKVATQDKKTNDTNKAEQEKQAAADKAAKEKQAATDKAAADAKAQEAKQQADAKKAQEAAAAQAAAQAAATPKPSGVASTGPSAVASTGPEDAIPYAIAIAALGFAGVTFVRSRRDLQRTIEQMLGATSV